MNLLHVVLLVVGTCSGLHGDSYSIGGQLVVSEDVVSRRLQEMVL